jgi:hypothetical protein
VPVVCQFNEKQLYAINVRSPFVSASHIAWNVALLASYLSRVYVESQAVPKSRQTHFSLNINFISSSGVGGYIAFNELNNHALAVVMTDTPGLKNVNGRSWTASRHLIFRRDAVLPLI